MPSSLRRAGLVGRDVMRGSFARPSSSLLHIQHRRSRRRFPLEPFQSWKPFQLGRCVTLLPFWVVCVSVFVFVRLCLPSTCYPSMIFISALCWFIDKRRTDKKKKYRENMAAVIPHQYQQRGGLNNNKVTTDLTDVSHFIMTRANEDVMDVISIEFIVSESISNWFLSLKRNFRMMIRRRDPSNPPWLSSSSSS